MSLPFPRLLLVLAVATSLAACKQGLGDRCQLNSDCDDSAYCAMNSNPGLGGVCTAKDTGADAGGTSNDFSGATAPDLTPAPDLTVRDLAILPDLTVLPDLPPPG